MQQLGESMPPILVFKMRVGVYAFVGSLLIVWFYSSITQEASGHRLVWDDLTTYQGLSK